MYPGRQKRQMHTEFWYGISKGREILGKLGKDRNVSDIKVGHQAVECCLRLVSGKGSFEYFTHKAKRLSTSVEVSCSLQTVNLTSHAVRFQKVPKRANCAFYSVCCVRCTQYAVHYRWTSRQRALEPDTLPQLACRAGCTRQVAAIYPSAYIYIFDG